MAWARGSAEMGWPDQRQSSGQTSAEGGGHTLAGVYAGMGMPIASSCEAASMLVGSTIMAGAGAAATAGRTAGATEATAEKAEAEATSAARRSERNMIGD